MTEIGFYQLLSTPLERALPKLLERALKGGYRAVVMAGSAERVALLDAALWTYDEASFLPHGTAQDGMAERQPIYLTALDENPNGANMLVLTEGVQPADLSGFERCLDIFDGRDETALRAARERWKALKAAGHSLTYWEQTPSGWEKKA